MGIKKIGLVLEQEEDAKEIGVPMEQLAHWRDKGEIEAIKSTLEALGYEVLILGTPKNILKNKLEIIKSVDFIFNLSVGFQSRFRLAEAPLLFELLDIPYSGADPYTKLTTQNKHIFKAFMDKMGISTPEWVYISRPKELTNISLPDFPLIVKPAFEGTSIGIYKHNKVNSFEELKSVINSLYDQLKMPMVIEQFISGSELKLGITGHSNKEFYLLEDVKEDGSSLGHDFLYYDVKEHRIYDKAFRDINKVEFKELKDMCEKVYDLYEPVDFGSFDIRCDCNGRYYIIEFNADATLHPAKTLSKCCELSGVSHKELIEKIMQSALERWELV